MCVHIFFICSSGDRHLGCFYVLAVVNDVAMNIGVHVSFLNSIFVFFGKPINYFLPLLARSGHEFVTMNM